MTAEFSIKAWAITGGILWGVYLFLATLLATWKINTFGFSLVTFKMITSVSPGLCACISGAFLGLLYGIICGAICGGLFAFIHNWAARLCEVGWK